MARPPQVAIDDATRKAVASASDPAASAWVSANAGSGKTFVLARRVVRLLLAGTDPGRILCLTFTKAAAAEMAKRVFATLAEWTTLSDAALKKEVTEIDARVPDADSLAAARRLFARALDTPGGLKIQTIHAFCERLLHQFPFEANVAGHFEILDERSAALLMNEARRRVLARAAAHPDDPVGRALDAVLSAAGDMAYEEALAAFVGARDRLRAWLDAVGGRDRARAELRATLGLDVADTVANLRQEILAESIFDAAAIKRLAALLAASDKATDIRAASRLAPYLAASSDSARVDAWVDLLTKSNGELRRPGSIVTRSLKDAWPGLEEQLADEVDRLSVIFDRIKAAECFATTAAMIDLADAAIEEYGRLKAGRGVLDFEDLILKTANLLSRSGAAEWVQYKLDRGLDHILVDEAQDTSPRQWQVIRTLGEEFFSGLGTSEATRTLFAVGDEKQSIFSFQGAVPAWFTRVQRELSRKARAADQAFEDVQLHLSFRSTEVVLSAVDAVFDPSEARSGVTGDEVWPFHTAARRRDPGRVIVWPLIEPPERPEPDDWAAPLDHLGDKSPEVTLAERIAATIDTWLKSGETLDATGEPIRPGQILILTRTRGVQTDAIIRALKNANVPIAGADRLQLADHIAIMDLMALGRTMLLPDDDLSLAAVLKSPLVGLSEDALFRLAHDRNGSLWEALLAAEEAEFDVPRARLQAWRADADWRDPHAFFARILGPGGGRKDFMRRLGSEAEDVIDEFLAQALAYERTETPSLQGFLAWLEGAPTEIKRDTDMLRDEVRVMTVHGAKGLESEIVFLVDTGSAPVHASHDPRVIVMTDDPDEAAPAPLVWMRSKQTMPETVKAQVERLRRRSAEEYRRLLYVAMTRARDRLYVCGTKKRTTDGALGWHGLVSNALEPESRRIELKDGTVELEWRAAPRKFSRKIDDETSAVRDDDLPAWACSPATPPPSPQIRLAPSSALRLDDDSDFAADLPAVGTVVEPSGALKRGRLIHRLLQSLPEHPAGQRRAIGSAYLAAIAPEIDGTAMLDEIMTVLENPQFAPFFMAGSRAEVDVAGQVALKSGAAMVSGRIDRLAVTESGVYIVDYKTNRSAPRRLDDVPEDYIAQLCLYRHILGNLYPNRPIAAALLWTGIPLLMEVPSRLLDEVESRLIVTESADLPKVTG